MIIIEGPDYTGKTVLAKKISDITGMPYYHYTKESTYSDYLKPLCTLNSMNIVADRWAFSEYPYSITIGRKFAFTPKEWHNIVLLTLIQKPVIVLCVSPPNPSDYSESQYLPYEKWFKCMELYRSFFDSNNIPYIEYDYNQEFPVKAFSILSSIHNEGLQWWVPMWKAGIGCIGSPNPDYLLVAERIGPNNINNLPFETGPTGHMLSQMLNESNTPLGSFAVTNMVKSYRRDTRLPNEEDERLLRIELGHLQPRKVIFMGNVAKQFGSRIAREYPIEIHYMTHFGYFSHKGITDITPLTNQWKKIISKGEHEQDGNRPALPLTPTIL